MTISRQYKRKYGISLAIVLIYDICDHDKRREMRQTTMQSDLITVCCGDISG